MKRGRYISTIADQSSHGQCVYVKLRIILTNKYVTRIKSVPLIEMIQNLGYYLAHHVLMLAALVIHFLYHTISSYMLYAIDILVAGLISPVASLVTTGRCRNVSMCLLISTKCFFSGIIPLLYFVRNKTYYSYYIRSFCLHEIYDVYHLRTELCDPY